MRVSANNNLSGQSQILNYRIVTNRFRSTLRTFTVESDVLLSGKTLLRSRESVCSFKETHLAMLGRHNPAKKGQVIPKSKYRLRFRDARVCTECLLEQRFGHWRDILVRETDVGDSKQCVARLDCGNADLSRPNEGVAGNDLLNDGHRSTCSFHDWWRDLSGQARLVVVEESAVCDDILRHWIQSPGKLGESDLFTTANAFNQTKIGGRQQSDILRVLTVDLFDALGDYEL